MAYASILASDGLVDSYVTLLGRRWSTGMGSEWNLNMPHCCQVDEALGRLRFELQNTPRDRGPGDASTKRRSELADMAKASNGVVFWEAFSLQMQPWSDREAMRLKLGSTAGSLHQMKWPSGDSPAYSLRVTGSGFPRITTSNDASKNTKRFTGSARLDDGKPHSFVFRGLLTGDTRSGLDVWQDGLQILKLRGVAIGSVSKLSGYKPSLGPYFAGGIGCPVVIEYAGYQPVTKQPIVPSAS